MRTTIEGVAWLIPYSVIRAYFVIDHLCFVIDQHSLT